MKQHSFIPRGASPENISKVNIGVIINKKNISNIVIGRHFGTRGTDPQTFSFDFLSFSRGIERLLGNKKLSREKRKRRDTK